MIYQNVYDYIITLIHFNSPQYIIIGIFLKYYYQAFLVDIFTKPEGAPESDPAKHVGMGFIYPENFKCDLLLKYPEKFNQIKM